MVSALALAVLTVLSALVVGALGLLRRSTSRRPRVRIGTLVGAGLTEPGAVHEPALVRVERSHLAWRRAGLAAGVGLAVLVVWAVPRWVGHDCGRSLLLVPALVGLGAVVGALVGEQRVRPPSSSTRNAGLVRRRPGDYLPRRLTWAVALTTVALGGLLVMTTHLGSADTSTGRAGGSLTLRCLARGVEVVSSGGPWLGRYYSLPLAVALLVVLVTTAVGARSAVLRPRVSADAGDRGTVEADERLRRRTAEALVAGFGLAVAATLLLAAPAAALVMGNAAGGSAYVEGRLLPSCTPEWWGPARWALVAATPVALAVLVWCAAVLLVPARRHDVTAGEP